MGIVDRRLKRLEEQITVPEDESRRWAQREFLKRLTFEEANCLDAPIHEAEILVDCPIHGPECACTNEQRRQRGFEAFPELYEEYTCRWQVLYERRYEILAREPEDPRAAWRKRHGIGA